MSLDKAKELRRDADYAFSKAQEVKAEAEASDDGWTEDRNETFARWMGDCKKAIKQAEELERKHDEVREMEERLSAREPALAELTRKGFDPDDFGAGGVEELENRFAEANERYNIAFERWLRRRPMDKEHRQALHAGPPMKDPETRNGIKHIGREYRAASQTVGTSGDGGVLVPEDFRRQLIEEQKAFGGMRRTRATIFETDSGADMPVPTMADTANTGSFVNEASTIGSVSKLAFKNVKLSAHVAQSGPILASIELLQDSFTDIASIVRRAAATRIGRVAEQKFFASTSSTGTPLGLVTTSTGAVAVAGSTALTRADLLDLKHAVDVAYRPTAEWMFSDNTFLDISKITDGVGRPLIELGLENREVNRLLGHPFVINNDVDDFGSNGNKPLWFGDFSHYFIRDVRPIELVRFNERFMEKRQVGWLLFQRLDGKPVSPTTTAAQRPLRCIVQG